MFKPLIELEILLKYRFRSDRSITAKKYKSYTGRTLNLDDPQTLTGKLNWLKLYDRNELNTLIADKCKVRDYVSQKIGDDYFVPLLMRTQNADDLVPQNLPEYPFIIKTNHNSGGGMIVMDKNTINWRKTRFCFSKLLKENYYVRSQEWQYKNVPQQL